MFSLDQIYSLISLAYVLLFLGLAVLAVWLPKSWLWKTGALLVVCATFTAPFVIRDKEEQARLTQNDAIADRFRKLCKENAGEKIYRTVEGVQGFLIMRPRLPATEKDYRDQYWKGDPYRHSNLEAENPAHVFLADRAGHPSTTARISPIAGYDFIEIQLTQDDSPERYQRIEVVKRHSDEPGNRLTTKTEYSRAPRSRYGYDWEDISTEKDRKYWIAGGRMRIVDLHSNTVIAERVGYVLTWSKAKE